MMIRKAKRSDAVQLGVVLKECYTISSLEEGKHVFLSEFGKAINYIVAEETSKIIGFVTWIPHGLPKHGLVELDRIGVLPAHRGNDVAQQLVNALIQEAQTYFEKNASHLRKLYLLTHADNARAQKFYAKMGLSPETTLKSHFYAEKDELVMSRFF